MELTFEEKSLVSRAEDLLERAGERHTLCATGFLSPAEQALLERTLPRGGDVSRTFWGGYDNAERAMFVCYPGYMEFDFARMGIAGSAYPNDGHHSDRRELYKNAPIVGIKIAGRDISRLTHRDFLGSVLALGIKRSVIGDILVGNGERGECLMFVDREIARYICENLTKIGNAGVAATLSNVDAAELATRATEEINGTVASVRIDAVLGIALKLSRAKAADLIASEAVALNWITVMQTHRVVAEGDIFSVKGAGRFRLKIIGNQSKKGRYHITIEKYL